VRHRYNSGNILFDTFNIIMALSLSKTVSKALGSVGKRSIVGPTDKFILSNKYFLWVVLAFALLNLLYMAIGGDYMSIIAFVLVGFLTSFFSKNMVVILLVAIVVGNVVRFGARSLQEGMKEGADGEEEEKEGMEDEEEKEGMEDEEEKEKEGMDDEEEEKSK
jgi:Sec-independent protein translocase protein TatA